MKLQAVSILSFRQFLPESTGAAWPAPPPQSGSVGVAVLMGRHVVISFGLLCSFTQLSWMRISPASTQNAPEKRFRSQAAKAAARPLLSQAVNFGAHKIVR